MSGNTDPKPIPPRPKPGPNLPEPNSILNKIADRFAEDKRIPVPPCRGIDLMWSQIGNDPREEVKKLIKQYFTKGPNTIIKNFPDIGCFLEGLDPAYRFPLTGYFGASCYYLQGFRGPLIETNDENYKLVNCYLGDVIWALFMEECGLLEILGAIIDQYTTNKDFSIPANNVTGLICEVVAENVRHGDWVDQKSRAKMYMNYCGMLPRQLQGIPRPSAKINKTFTDLFPQLISQCLRWFQETQVVQVIQATAGGEGSTANLVGIGSIARSIFENEDLMMTGRSYKVLVDTICYELVTIDLVRLSTDYLGIPSTRDLPKEYIKDAYSKLVKKENQAQPNRYVQYQDLADCARYILLAFEKVDHNDVVEIEELLKILEPKIQKFATAYETLFGIKLSGRTDISGNISFVQTVSAAGEGKFEERISNEELLWEPKREYESGPDTNLYGTNPDVNIYLDGPITDNYTTPEITSRGYVLYQGTDPPGYDHWGTKETIDFIKEVGKEWHKNYQNGPMIAVGDISIYGGGPFWKSTKQPVTPGTTPIYPPNKQANTDHKGHQDGRKIDIRPIRNDNVIAPFKWTDTSVYDQGKTRKLIEILIDTGKVSKILFNDPDLIEEFDKVEKSPGHDDHLHVNL